jgi:hypothetical protein
MDDVELDNERHKREEQERRAKRKVRKKKMSSSPATYLRRLREEALFGTTAHYTQDV